MNKKLIITIISALLTIVTITTVAVVCVKYLQNSSIQAPSKDQQKKEEKNDQNHKDLKTLYQEFHDYVDTVSLKNFPDINPKEEPYFMELHTKFKKDFQPSLRELKQSLTVNNSTQINLLYDKFQPIVAQCYQRLQGLKFYAELFSHKSIVKFQSQQLTKFDYLMKTINQKIKQELLLEELYRVPRNRFLRLKKQLQNKFTKFQIMQNEFNYSNNHHLNDIEINNLYHQLKPVVDDYETQFEKLKNIYHNANYNWLKIQIVKIIICFITFFTYFYVLRSNIADKLSKKNKIYDAISTILFLLGILSMPVSVIALISSFWVFDKYYFFIGECCQLSWLISLLGLWCKCLDKKPNQKLYLGSQ